jgi:hypothetical protein
MKKILYITAILALSSMVSSCQKDEFIDDVNTVNTSAEAKKGKVDDVVGDDKVIKDTGNDSISIFYIDPVKEVSDGDDEADSGDDSKSKN